MKITDKLIDYWILHTEELQLKELLQNLKEERSLLVQQLKNAESQIGHLTHLTSGLRK